jgi:hypothetical protein
MTKEILKKNIDEMEIYIPVSAIEKNLGMPKTTIQQVLNGHRNLPKKWVKVLERYFNGKLYLGENNLRFTKIDFKPTNKESYDGKKSIILSDEMGQWQSVSLRNIRKDIGKVAFTEEQILSLAENSKSKKEMPQGLSRTDQMKWIRNNS